MRVIPLAHRRALHYPACSARLQLDSLAVRMPQNTTVLTFARTGSLPRRLDATDRLQGVIADGHDVVLSCFDDSPLSAMLFWDVAHHLAVGARLYLQSSDGVADLAGRSYYQDAFQALTMAVAAPGLTILEKVAPLAAEAERGLMAWSFCIPTGDGDPAVLNACVERILSLGIPQTEILLCGRPRADFRFHDQVRVVGEDIPAFPVHITRKKNVMAREARYPNLCILHDRVLLPRNFYDAVQRFGDDYPMTAFSSFWFADTWQAAPRRYSDFCVAQRVPDVLRAPERPGRSELAVFESMGFQMQHPARSDFGRDYLTGSLYLCRRAVWLHMPQNEALYWGEYEDVEQGIRAAMAGIPSRLNPYGLTQSLAYRNIFHLFGMATGVDQRGRSQAQRSPTEWWGFPRRPHLRISQEEGHRRLAAFARKYTGNDLWVRQVPASLSGVRRYALIARLLWAVRGDVSDLVADWYHLVLCEGRVAAEAEGLQAVLDSSGSAAYRRLVFLRHPSLMRQVYNNPFSSPFQAGYPPSATGALRCAAGGLLAAFWLAQFSCHVALRIPFWSLWRLVSERADIAQETPHDVD